MTEELKNNLILWANAYETPDFVASDPVRFPRLVSDGMNLSRLTDEEQRRIETVAVITAWVSYGNRKQIIKTTEMLLDIVNREGSLLKCFYRFKYDDRPLYRFFKWSDFSRLCVRLDSIYDLYPTLESGVLDLSNDPLTGLIGHFKGVKGFPKDSTSACKRLCMMLRWLVRRDSPVDIGCWTSFDPAKLIIPLDTHVHRMALDLGLTKRKQADMRTAIEVTEALKEVFPDDPTRGDFALFGYGIAHTQKNK